MITMARSPLVTVYCRNALCPYYIKGGRRRVVGRISERAELRCFTCREVALYEV